MNETRKPQLDEIVDIVTRNLDAQAIYLFGSFGTADEQAESDLDIALLLSPQQAKQIGDLAWSDLRSELEDLVHKPVDLINLRRAPTVLQKEVLAAGRRIYQSNMHAANEFEMLTMSYYQKLNQERAEIIADAFATGRFIT